MNQHIRFAPVERFATAAIWAALAGSAAWYAATTTTSAQMFYMSVVAVVCLAGVPLSLRRFTEFDETGGVDVSGLRRTSFAWTQVKDIFIGRAPGIGGGYCLVLDMGDSGEFALRGTRVYSKIPSAKHHDELVALRNRLVSNFLQHHADSSDA